MRPRNNHYIPLSALDPGAPDSPGPVGAGAWRLQYVAGLREAAAREAGGERRKPQVHLQRAPRRLPVGRGRRAGRGNAVTPGNATWQSGVHDLGRQPSIRWLLAAVGAALILIGLAACNGQPDGTPTGQGAAADPTSYIDGNGKYHALADGRGDHYSITHGYQESHANDDSHGRPHTLAYGWQESPRRCRRSCLPVCGGRWMPTPSSGGTDWSRRTGGRSRSRTPASLPRRTRPPG